MYWEMVGVWESGMGLGNSIFLTLSDHYLAVLAITARTDCNV